MRQTEKTIPRTLPDPAFPRDHTSPSWGPSASKTCRGGCTFRPIKTNDRILSAYLPSYRGGLPEIRSGGMRQRACAGYKRPMAGQTMSPAIFGYAPGMRRVQKIQLATLVDSGARPEITPGEPRQITKRTKSMRWTVCARGYTLDTEGQRLAR